MKTYKCIQLALAFLFFGVLSSCESGGGDQVAGIGGTGAGIGGTGYTASGPIDGFGSIFVNGIEFDTDTALVSLDGASVSDSDLRLGMIVTVVGTLDADGMTGTAESVSFNDEIQGPIAAISSNADGTEKTLTVLGVYILVAQGATIFDDVTFESLAINDLIEVSGFIGANAVIQATRVEKKETFVAGESEIGLKGTVAGLSGTQFSLGSFIVDFAGADLSDIPNGKLTNGLLVEVKGTLSGSIITAEKVEGEEGAFEDNSDGASLEGFISSFVSDSDFVINGQAIDASSAVLHPVGLQLQNGIQVQVQGTVANGVLIADEIESRSSEIKLMAPVQSLDVSNGAGTIVLAYAVGNISFVVNNETESADETDTFDSFNLSNLRVGDFLEVKALVNGTQITATELRLRQVTDELIEGSVVGFVTNTTVTVLGLTYTTTGASFEDVNDLPITSGVFYTQLRSGDIVKIQDDDPADGIADEVELED
jgi:hypothetical protein